MTDQDWENPQTQDPSTGDAVADGRPTPGRPREMADVPPGSNEWREAAGQPDHHSESDQRPGAGTQRQEVRGAQLDQGTRDDTELGT